jgi:hypothetical protein
MFLAVSLASSLASCASAAATGTPFTPTTGQTVVIGSFTLTVTNVMDTQWAPPAGVRILHAVTVRVSDGSDTRTVTLSLHPRRLDVMHDHGLRLLEEPLRIAIEPAPPLRVPESTAARLARERVAALGWSGRPVVTSSVLVERRTWEVWVPLAEDLDAVVHVDGETGAVLDAYQTGGP